MNKLGLINLGSKLLTWPWVKSAVTPSENPIPTKIDLKSVMNSPIPQNGIPLVLTHSHMGVSSSRTKSPPKWFCCPFGFPFQPPKTRHPQKRPWPEGPNLLSLRVSVSGDPRSREAQSGERGGQRRAAGGPRERASRG